MRTVIRVKWTGGYVDVFDPLATGYTRTIPLDAANLRTKDAAIQAGLTVLTEYGGRRSYQLQVGDTPSWPATGDGIATLDMDETVATHRILGRRVAISDTGFAQLEPTLASRQDQLIERNQRLLKQITSGAVGGRTSAGEPLQLVESNVLSGQISDSQVLTWSFPEVKEKYAAIEKTTEDITFTRLQVLMTSTKKIDEQNQTIPDTLPFPIVFQILMNGTAILPQGISFPGNTAEYNFLGINYRPKETTFQVGIINYNYNVNPALGNSSSGLKRRAMTFKLHGVSGSFIRENKITPEIR